MSSRRDFLKGFAAAPLLLLPVPKTQPTALRGFIPATSYKQVILGVAAETVRAGDMVTVVCTGPSYVPLHVLEDALT